ncbi:MAG: class I SAM-dependent methyltransferase [Firmicutes bacterium]|nr:class I SAM-dependent methyltransferase [Bacillota bacterium]
MGFYEELSKYYDIIFPYSKVKLDFILDKIEGEEPVSVLDIACGTGSYSIELAKLGHKVSGIDLDEDMIRIAKEKSAEFENEIDFRVADMRDIKEIFDTTFDLIYCIGNSLVHLQSYEDVISELKLINEMLKEKGKLVIQIINYDRIFKYDLECLPTIDREEEGVKFIRKYDYNLKEDKMYFNTKILIDRDGEAKEYDNSVPLLPLRSNVFNNMLKDCGFNKINFYGDFNGSKFNSESYPLIVVAEK